MTFVMSRTKSELTYLKKEFILQESERVSFFLKSLFFVFVLGLLVGTAENFFGISSAIRTYVGYIAFYLFLGSASYLSFYLYILCLYAMNAMIIDNRIPPASSSVSIRMEAVKQKVKAR